MKRGRTVLIFVGAILAVFFAIHLLLNYQSTSQRDATIARLIARADIVSALKAANLRDQSECKRVDKLWIAEYRNSKPNGVVSAFMSSQLSRRLAEDAAASSGQIEQIMLFDAAGCLVAADHPTHDYDQSDEDKWKLTVGSARKDLIFEGRDNDPKGSTDQVSQAVTDKQGKIIGGITLRWCHTAGGCL